MKKQYRSIKFAIEDGEVFDGFFPVDLSNEPFHGYWNGWLCPYVDEQTHLKICSMIMKNLEWIEALPEEYEDLSYYANMKPNEDGLYYWGGCYIWSEVTTDEAC